MGTPIVKILVASHKKYRMPSDDIYLPLHVGARLLRAHRIILGMEESESGLYRTCPLPQAFLLEEEKQGSVQKYPDRRGASAPAEAVLGLCPEKTALLY